MDCSKIIIDGYNAATPKYVIDKTLLVKHFVGEAKKAKNNEYYKYSSFFNECKRLTTALKNSIELQLKQSINEHNWMIEKLKKGETNPPITDSKALDEAVKGWERQRDNQNLSLFKAKFKNYDTEFYYSDLEIIEQAIIQAEQELIQTNNTDKSQQNIIPIDILLKLEKQGFIKLEPLEWLKSKSLLAYFVDVANDKLNLKHGQKRLIKPFETMFNVSGLVGCINEYRNKTGQYPQGYKEIDSLFV